MLYFRYWRRANTPPLTRTGLFDVWGRSASDVWAVGDRLILHFDGQSWREIRSEGTPYNTFTSVWASGPDDVWVVGTNGYILRGGVSGFKLIPSGTDRALFGIWGSSPTDIWAVGQDGTVLRYGPGPASPTPDGGASSCKQLGESCDQASCCGTLRCTPLGASILVCG